MIDSQNTQEILKKTKDAILSCDVEAVKAVVNEAIDAKIDPLLVIEEGLTPVLREMGIKFEKQEIYLPQLVMASEAMKAGMELLTPLLPIDQRSKSSLGKIVIGTVEGIYII
jgi:methanogenic corrinoid protein MtbC1